MRIVDNMKNLNNSLYKGPGNIDLMLKSNFTAARDIIHTLNSIKNSYWNTRLYNFNGIFTCPHR